MIFEKRQLPCYSLEFYALRGNVIIPAGGYCMRKIFSASCGEVQRKDPKGFAFTFCAREYRQITSVNALSVYASRSSGITERET